MGVRPTHPSVRKASQRGNVVVSEPEDDWSGAWAYLGVLVGFKLVGLAIIVWAMAQAGAVDGALQFLILYHVPVVLVLIALVYWPAAFWYRRLRARARRGQLIRGEWNVGSAAPTHRHGPR